MPSFGHLDVSRRRFLGMCHFLGPVGKLWALAQVGAELVPARLAVILPCGPYLSSSE